MPEWEELKDWPKRLKKTLVGPYLLRWRQSVSLHTWHRQGPHKPSNCATFMLNSHQAELPQAKSLTSMCAGSLWSCPTLYGPVDRPRCQGGGFSRQEHWSVLANAGCHTPLEHCIPAALAANPLSTRAARTPATQAAALPHHLASQGQTRVLQGSLRSRPQWTTHVWRGK